MTNGTHSFGTHTLAVTSRDPETKAPLGKLRGATARTSFSCPKTAHRSL